MVIHHSKYHRGHEDAGHVPHAPSINATKRPIMATAYYITSQYTYTVLHRVAGLSVLRIYLHL